MVKETERNVKIRRKLGCVGLLKEVKHLVTPPLGDSTYSVLSLQCHSIVSGYIYVCLEKLDI